MDHNCQKFTKSVCSIRNILAVGYLRHFEKVDEYVYLDVYVEKIMNVYISIYSSV